MEKSNQKGVIGMSMHKIATNKTNIRIFSDGTPAGTHVKTIDGNKIGGITKLKWEADANGVATCELHIVGVPVELEGHITNLYEVARKELFRDTDIEGALKYTPSDEEHTNDEDGE